MLDDAVWRRFDEVLYCARPTPQQLAKLMDLRLGSVRTPEVDLDSFAQQMAGFSYADAERPCLEAVKAVLLRGLRELHASCWIESSKSSGRGYRLHLERGSSHRRIWSRFSSAVGRYPGCTRFQNL